MNVILEEWKKKIFFFKVFIKMSSCLFSQNKKYIALAKKF